ncbi:hypothetical protein PMI07_006570 [Rhizobium sp. CF080]|uniref:hypothetical protein n=1 Tax=Rhizobium sp. (strain CF080) TaxID=1144310 RepID=UPI0002717051|nr:hypothetical protein [Rhizobium sp. CF080]EUB98256.1 hypothetical protein PMI07_006570 [Rhizobium sp. CF080]
MTKFHLHMHPASEGDALMLSWGDAERPGHAMVDMGRSKDYVLLKPLLQDIGKLDLFVVSHIDADHIAGVVPLFEEKRLPFSTAHVWFNAHEQLSDANDRLAPSERVVLGVAQGEKVSAGIAATDWPWNAHAKSRVISIDSPEGAQPIPFDGGLTVRLLSPSDRKLAALLPAWNDALEKAHLRDIDDGEPEEEKGGGRVRLGGLNVDALASARFLPDSAKPNGTSIAFVAEYGGKRILLAADAHPDILERTLRGLGASEDSRYQIDCFKVSHHGSKANTSASLLSIIDCRCFAFSTDGSHHNHPDPEAIARILKVDPVRPKTLVFNFRQPSTLCWDNRALMDQWNYNCVFPEEGKNGIGIDLLHIDDLWGKS